MAKDINPPSLPSCEPINHVNECCPDVHHFVVRPACDIPIHIEPCEFDKALADCEPCQCVPDFCVDELAMTPAAKAAVMLMLERMLQLVSPVARCEPCGDPLSTIGHNQPLSGTQKHNDMGQPLFEQCNPDGSVGETTNAFNSVTGQMNAAVLDNMCCASGLMHSAFLNRGQSPLRHKGGNAPGYLGGVGGLFSSEYHEKMGELFCCAYEAVQEAPVLVLEDEEPAEGKSKAKA